MSQWTYRDTKEHPILRVTRLIEASNNISNGESISKDLVIRRRSKLDINTREKSKIKNEKSHFVQKVHMIDIEKKGCTSVIRFIHFYIVIWFNVFETTIWQVLFISMRHTKKVPPVALVILTISCIKGDHGCLQQIIHNNNAFCL